MAIRITLRGTDYEAVVTPSDHMTVTWVSGGPMHGRDVITKLLELGFHQQDVVDAFAAADPGFVTKLNRGDFNTS
jgi:electron transfer flavoprotein alpha/beta subunit